jgi:predicted RNA-binding protein
MISLLTEMATRSNSESCPQFADRLNANPNFTPVQSTPASITSLLELKAILQERNSASTGRQFDLSAHFGQLVFPNTFSEMTATPLPKAFEGEDLEEWLEKAGNPIFFPR